MKQDDRRVFEELKAGYVDYTNTSGCSSHRMFMRLHLAEESNDAVITGDTASSRRLSPNLQRRGAVERRRRRNNRPGMAG